MSDKSNRLKSVAPVENSEHLTGFSVDVVDKKDPKTFDLDGNYKAKAWEWVEANCGKYGFEVSFPKGNKQGLNYEPWHLRYIGPEVPAELQLVFAYAKSGGNADEATLDKICKESPKTESIEHTQDDIKSRTDLDLDRIVKTHSIEALTVITGKGTLNSKKAANYAFNAASAIKLHIAHAVYQHVSSLNISIDTNITASPNVLAENEPEYPSGKSFSIKYLINKMLEVSSNTATNMLIQYIGGISLARKKVNTLGYSLTLIKDYISLPGKVVGDNPDVTNTSSTFDMAKAIFQLLKLKHSLQLDVLNIIVNSLSKAEVPKGMRNIKFNKIGYNSRVNVNVAVYQNSNGYFIIAAANLTESRDFELTKVMLATNEVTQAIDNLELEGIDFTKAPGTASSAASSAAAPRSTTAKSLPVLMYHSIGNGEIDPKYARYEVTPERFRGHMQHLKSLGYTAVLANNIISGDLPDKPIVITFDDGCLNNLTNAVPIMREFGMRGLFFITTDWLGKTHPEYKVPIMNSNQVAQLVNGGHEVGSHSLSHPRLLDISEAQLTKELVDSKNILSYIVGANIKSFSYPFGRTNSSIVQATAKYYQLAYMAFLTSDNPGNSKHMINRVEIDGKVSDYELEIKAQHEHNFLKLT